MLEILTPYVRALQVAAVAIAAGGIWYYGHVQYQAGYHERGVIAVKEAAEILTKSRAKEQAAQTKMEQVQHDALEQRQDAERAATAAANESGRLRDEIARQRRKLETAGGSTRDDAETARAWQLLDTCRARYEAVARDADRYVEQLRLAQGWARVIESAR